MRKSVFLLEILDDRRHQTGCQNSSFLPQTIFQEPFADQCIPWQMDGGACGSRLVGREVADFLGTEFAASRARTGIASQTGMPNLPPNRSAARMVPLTRSTARSALGMPAHNGRNRVTSSVEKSMTETETRSRFSSPVNNNFIYAGVDQPGGGYSQPRSPLEIFSLHAFSLGYPVALSAQA